MIRRYAFMVVNIVAVLSYAIAAGSILYVLHSASKPKPRPVVMCHEPVQKCHQCHGYGGRP